MPVNTTIDESHCFKPYLTYKFPAPKIRYIKSAFITSTGLVCGKKGLIKECLHHTWELQFEVLLNKASRFYHDAIEDSQKLLIFDDDETYLVAHHPWFGNYYHWITETIFRLWMVKNNTEQMILLLPSKDLLPKIAMDSLRIFKFKHIVHVPAEKSSLVRTLCMPELKPDMASFNSDALLELNRMYVNYVNSKTNVNINVGERVYVSRRNAKRRKIENEDEVIALFTEYDFTIVYNEDYTFFEQVSLFSNAKYLAGLHGAGLTNMLFMPSGCTIFEFHKRKTNAVRHHNLIFWYMANGLGHKYYHQICDPTDVNEPFYTANVVINIKLLTKNLELIFNVNTK